jgi:short subunit dehydrogenase-like uncharacterized protein
MEITRAAILGATGVTGKYIARELVRRGVSTRVVSRSSSRLQAAFQRYGCEITGRVGTLPLRVQPVPEQCWKRPHVSAGPR